MRILLTGGTGFIGNYLGQTLVRQGHQVVVLSRQREKTLATLPYPADVHSWDATKGIPPKEAFAGVEAVINLAGAPIAGKRWSEKQKAAIRDTRVDGTKNLIQGVAEFQPSLKAFISGSAIGFYGNRGDEELTEDSDVGQGFVADVVVNWERAADEVLKYQPQVRLTKIRTGVVLGDGGGFLKEVLPIFRSGVGGPLANGKQWMSWVHIKDLVRLIMFCLERDEAQGVFNGVAPQPVTNKELTKTLGRVLNVPTALPAPRVGLRLAFGEMADILLTSQKVIPRRTQDVGFHFEFSELEGALRDILPDAAKGEQRFQAEQWLPITPEEAFSFFKEAHNLEVLTPPWLNFEILGKTTEEVQEGTKIDYRLKIRGVPVKWRSEILDWRENQSFVDIQLKGPYKSWHHLHEFEPMAGGTLLRDRVTYSLPLGAVGRLAAGTLVEKDVGQIFAYRQQKIYERFCASSP